MVFSEQLGLYSNNFTQLLGLLNLCSGKIYSDMVSTFVITHFPIVCVLFKHQIQTVVRCTTLIMTV